MSVDGRSDDAREDDAGSSMSMSELALELDLVMQD